MHGLFPILFYFLKLFKGNYSNIVVIIEFYQYAT